MFDSGSTLSVRVMILMKKYVVNVIHYALGRISAFSWQWSIYQSPSHAARIVNYLRSSLGSLKEVSCKVPVSPFILFTLAQTYRKCCSAKTHCEEIKSRGLVCQFSRIEQTRTN